MNSIKSGKPISHLFKEFKDDGANIKSTSKSSQLKSTNKLNSNCNTKKPPTTDKSLHSKSRNKKPSKKKCESHINFSLSIENKKPTQSIRSLNQNKINMSVYKRSMHVSTISNPNFNDDLIDIVFIKQVRTIEFSQTSVKKQNPFENIKLSHTLPNKTIKCNNFEIIPADKPCQVYARVTRILGQGYLEAVCYEEKDQFVVHCKRLCHIRGKMRKREWIKTNDIVLVSLREFELNKADVIHVYQKREATYLRINGEIPQVDGAIEMEEFSQRQQNNFKAYHLQDFLKEGL